MSQQRKGKQEIHENNYKHMGVEKVQIEELRSGRKQCRMFVSKGGVGALHWQREAKQARLNIGAMHVGEPL